MAAEDGEIFEERPAPPVAPESGAGAAGAKTALEALHLRLWRAAAPPSAADERASERAGQDYLTRRPRGSSPTILFDPISYAQQLPWFVREKVDPLDHYLTTGWSAGLSPHVAFDPDFVAEQLGVVAWTEPPLLAFFEGAKELSAHPLFDADIYARHVDVESIPFARLFEFFVDWSGPARAPFSRLFSVMFYGRSEPITRWGTVNPLVHYLMADVERRRDPSPLFHNRWYDAQYPAKKGQPSDPLIRFARIGMKEGHLPNPFARPELRLYVADTGVPVELLLPYVDISEFDRIPQRAKPLRSNDDPLEPVADFALGQAAAKAEAAARPVPAD